VALTIETTSLTRRRRIKTVLTDFHMACHLLRPLPNPENLLTNPVPHYRYISKFFPLSAVQIALDPDSVPQCRSMPLRDIFVGLVQVFGYSDAYEDVWRGFKQDRMHPRRQVPPPPLHHDSLPFIHLQPSNHNLRRVFTLRNRPHYLPFLCCVDLVWDFRVYWVQDATPGVQGVQYIPLQRVLKPTEKPNHNYGAIVCFFAFHGREVRNRADSNEEPLHPHLHRNPLITPLLPLPPPPLR